MQITNPINNKHYRYYSLEHYHLSHFFKNTSVEGENLSLLYYQKNEKTAAYNIAKILNKSLNFVNKSFPKDIIQYKLELSHMPETYSEKVRNFKSFCPAGLCWYNEKIIINTNLYPYYSEDGRRSDRFRLNSLLFHELGHAIHVLKSSYFIKEKYLKDFKLVVKHHFLQHDDFLTVVKKSYRNYQASFVDKRNERYLSYFVRPENSYLNSKLPFWRRKGAWARACEESFAESFSLLMNLFVHGLDDQHYQAIYKYKTHFRSYIKVMLPSIIYLLKHIDWIKLGVSEQVYRKRLPLIKIFLEKIDSLPHTLKKADVKIHMSKKNITFPKVSYRKLNNI